MFNKLNPKQNFSELENEITTFWKQNDIFRKSISQRDPKNKYVFYDGPPFITGTPHYGSLLPSIAKDVVPRYWTMNGKYVERKWGWDCHGLPIENKVEKKLNLANRREIEKFGIQRFIDECYTYTRDTSAEWRWYIDKIGRWVDMDNSYKTMDQDYMESVIWVFKQLWEKELIYEGTRTSLYCTRCGTPVSNFEIAMDNSYADMQDPAVTIKFPITSKGTFQNAKLLAWTTTPWTLPSNKALVIDPESEYVLFSLTKPHDKLVATVEEQFIIAKPRLQKLLEGVELKISSEFKGKDLVGLEYQAPFSYFEAGENAHKVYAFPGMVHMNEGTGIVHSAPGFGDIDTQMGQHYQIEMAMSIDDQGKYLEQVSDYKGIYVKEADSKIMEDLRTQQILFKQDTITHRYPFCYRCETPLIHKAQPSWFIDIQKLKPNLLKNNDVINWVPEHLKDGRFKKGISVAPDWGISRTRYWATPMPVWQRVENGKVVERVVIGSRDELREKAMQPITKLLFVRHAERDKSEADGELNAKGWEQVEKLKLELADHKFDHIFASATKRTQQTVAEIASMHNTEVLVNDVFGSLNERAEIDQILSDITQKYPDAASYAELPEKELRAAFAKLIDTVTQKLNQFLLEHSGKYILVATHGERIGLIRHIVEGRNLNECLALEVGYAETLPLFFNQTQLLDLHRPKIDNITLKGEVGELTRVSEVLDVWMDSASMPYAQKHYPFENKQDFEENFPADFIVEYIAQTRAWFYVMHVISSALLDTNSFKNVVTTGVIFGTDGRKMSKSYGNYPDPRKILEQYGAEALRLYLMGSRIMVGEDIRIDEEGFKEQIRNFLLPLWNSLSFFITYANLHNWKPEQNLAQNERNSDTNTTNWDHIPFGEVHNKLDHWLIAKLQLAIRDFRMGMDEYNIPAAVRVLPRFLEDLSKWYIRRSRDRFAKGDPEALATLYYVLVEFAKLMAPVTPFVSEKIYQELVAMQWPDATKSIHLCDFPQLDMKFTEHSSELLLQMEKVRNIVNLGQALRMTNNLKVKQPLEELEVKTEIDQNRDHDFEEWMKDLIKEELNVKNVDERQELLTKEGWLYSKDEEHQIEINLNTNISAELKREGIIRELSRKVQHLRKKRGLNLGDKIKIALYTTDSDTLEALNILRDQFVHNVSAQEVLISASPLSEYEVLKFGDTEVWVMF